MNFQLSTELDLKKQELMTTDVALNEERKNLQIAIQKLEAAQKKAEERVSYFFPIVSLNSFIECDLIGV